MRNTVERYLQGALTECIVQGHRPQGRIEYVPEKQGLRVPLAPFLLS
jgi:hypothetical protein